MRPRATGTIRVGIVGAGLIGNAHSRMLKLIAGPAGDRVRVTAVADVASTAAGRLAACWPGARVARTAGELLAAEPLDAVWICTPTRHHRDLCLAAATAGVNLFTEKPLAMSAAEAEQMADAVARAGVIAQVGLVLRFSPVYNVMRAILAEAGVGRILAVVMRDDQDFPIRGIHASAWRNDPALSAGGTLIEHSIHDIDLLTWMFGPVTRISCRTRNFAGAPGIEDFASVELEFAAGFSAHLTSAWHKIAGRPSNRRLEIFAENLFLASDFDFVGPIIIQRDSGAEQVMAADEVARRFTAILLDSRPCLASVRELAAMPYAMEDAAFLAALRGECAPDPDMRAGVAAQALVDLAYESARAGAVVAVRS
jgi:predicted dehydrogenase